MSLLGDAVGGRHRLINGSGQCGVSHCSRRGRLRLLVLVLAGLVAIWAPQGAFATNFDFDLLELEVATPVSVVLDDFEDGVKNPLLLEIWGSTTESGGALRFTDTDGCLVRPNGRCADLIFVAIPFFDGGGNTEITATLAPVTPGANLQLFVLLLDVDPLPEPVFGIFSGSDQNGPLSPCGVGLQVLLGLLPQDGSGVQQRCIGVRLAARRFLYRRLS